MKEYSLKYFILVLLALLAVANTFALRRLQRKWTYCFVLSIFGALGGFLAGLQEVRVQDIDYLFPQDLSDLARQLLGVLIASSIVSLYACASLVGARGAAHSDDELGPRCSQCGYCLFGLERDNCPECGRPFR